MTILESLAGKMSLEQIYQKTNLHKGTIRKCLSDLYYMDKVDKCYDNGIKYFKI